MIWVLLSSGNMFLMQAGFQFMEAGMVRRKNQRNAVLKSYLGICLGAIFFYLIGYGIGFGDPKDHNKFAGVKFFADQMDSF